jgi:signal transduction histidine kinase
MMKYSKPIEITLKKAQQEIRELRSELKAGTLNRKRLKSGLKEIQQRLKVMNIHNHKPDPEDDDK